jgi:hypothetical protein
MFYRAMLAALCVGFAYFAFAANEADARSAGHAGGGRAASGPRSLQRFHHAPAFKGATAGLHVTRHLHPHPFHHHHFRHRWPFVFAAPYVFGEDFVVPPAAFADNGGVPPGEPVIINRRQCFMQPHIVPAEGTGTMRTVTVTRCY